MIYKWGSRTFSVNAQVIGETVEQIQAENEGICSPDAFVEIATPKSHPAHPAFTWDNKKAGHNWRKQEARQLMNSLIVVTVDGDHEPPPAFVHIKIERNDGEKLEGYASTGRVMSDTELRKQALMEAIAMLNGFRRRYHRLSELNPLWDALELVEKEAR